MAFLDEVAVYLDVRITDEQNLDTGPMALPEFLDAADPVVV